LNDLKIEYSDKEVTAWGGMKLMKNLLDGIGIREFMRTLCLPVSGSNRGYDAVQIIESFWVGMWIGASRFTHCGWLRFDKVLQKIFDWKHVPSQSTLSRFFHKFNWKRNDDVFIPLQKWFFGRLQFDNITLDLDSSVITRYGKQEGAKVGYNAQKPGRASHHPLMAFNAELRMVVNAWLRPGNTGSLSNSEAFMNETFSILGDKKVGLVRADSGFFGQSFLEYFETRKIHYITAVKMFSTIKAELFRRKNWVVAKRGIEITEWTCHLPGWKKARRMIAVRKNIEECPKATGKLLLFEMDETRYRYSVFVTDLDLPAEQIWNLYRDRADAENRIKELKADFGLSNFCLSKFFATEAAFRFMMVAYNLMSLFRQFVLNKRNQSTLSTLRFKCFALGAWISEHANQKILKIALSREKRDWLDGLFDITRRITPQSCFSNA